MWRHKYSSTTYQLLVLPLKTTVVVCSAAELIHERVPEESANPVVSRSYPGLVEDTHGCVVVGGIEVELTRGSFLVLTSLRKIHWSTSPDPDSVLSQSSSDTSSFRIGIRKPYNEELSAGIMSPEPSMVTGQQEWLPLSYIGLNPNLRPLPRL